MATRASVAEMEGTMGDWGGERSGGSRGGRWLKMAPRDAIAMYVDAKVDALAKLQVEFENGAEIPDADATLTVFKACLRTANQHLSTATLTALPPLLPLLVARHTLTRSTSNVPNSPTTSTSSTSPSAVDAHSLRQVLSAFLPSGGIIERLGDSREKSREKAREALVLLGGFAFRSGGTSAMMNRSREGKGPETPMQIFEKYFRELGLASKVWRVREQAVLTLVHLRRAHHLFPIRAYLPALVEALEDTDGNVRECARQSVVELFTGPGVTDAARADLKKEMTKKGVRKTIVDSVLLRVLAGGSGGASTPGTMSDAGSENGDAAQKEYVPPSIALMNRRPTQAAVAGLPRTASQSSVGSAPRPASRSAMVSPPPVDSPIAASASGSDVKPVYVASVHDLENEFASMLRHFEGRENEHNWAAREQSVQLHTRFHDAFLFGLKNSFINASLKTLASLRTTVAVNTCMLYSELAVALGADLDPCCEVLYLNLLRMGSLTKKITAQHSQDTADTIMAHVSAQPRFVIPTLWNCMQDKSVQMRHYALGHVQVYLDVHGARAKHAIESSGGVDHLEKTIKKGLGDPNPKVRDNARKAFWAFESIWSEKGAAILNTLDSTARKQVERACPNPHAVAALSTTETPKPKKSSVAAAIAATRAKAKANAAAPPSLRHQATSTSQAVRAMSPTGRHDMSPPLTASTSMGSVRATSPTTRSPPRSRIISGTMSRSVSSGTTTSSRPRTSSGQPPPASPPSPTPGPGSAFRRRASSPLVVPPSPPKSPPSSQSVFRRAVHTALPASPPSSSVITFTDPAHKPGRPAAAVPLPRESLSIAGMHGHPGTEEESLLLAMKIPIPEDSDSDMDESVNLLSFSAPYEMYPPIPKPRANSQAASFSPRSSSSRPGPSKALSTSTNSPPSSAPQVIVEDALRARAEQAESAAERLLELVEPEEDGVHASPIPASLMRGAMGTPRTKVRTAGPNSAKAPLSPPRTPVNKTAAMLKQAALLQDSPAANGKSANVFSMVNGTDTATEWWRKRTSLIKSASPLLGHEDADRERELQGYISALEDGSADIPALQNMALLCTQMAVIEVSSPTSPDLAASPTPSPVVLGSSNSLPSLAKSFWFQHKNLDHLFDALISYLNPTQDEEKLQYGLIVLWEMIVNQWPLLEGKEAGIFSVLLQVRYCARANVMQATNMFRDALAVRVDAVYGLTTLHACVRAFRNATPPDSSSAEIKDGTYAFGLVALGKFILRLPAEVLEEELPRLRATLISASDHTSLTVREAAAAAIIAAQLVLRDEAHLFALLDGLPDGKKNLLTYLFDKHGCRDTSETLGPSRTEKLEREMRRLDNRTNTPPRPPTTSSDS
ncbi:clasp N terminal-domain-containing protein [Fomitopsis serialis]|uniref:clasp N terminal-domain-containing protein n=1 Tax=Fomitopsis serialis TaxID=139415 RepID=UPI002007EFEE|nr:clasp N terminal-domain-containing protein [Neoantrodia serialis]KAH9938409.1 clasp N terminal-domain-containing protein [Neoantrodia serialis]